MEARSETLFPSEVILLPPVIITPLELLLRFELMAGTSSASIEVERSLLEGTGIAVEAGVLSTKPGLGIEFNVGALGILESLLAFETLLLADLEVVIAFFALVVKVFFLKETLCLDSTAKAKPGEKSFPTTDDDIGG